MRIIIPPKLKIGDEVRVVAPALSLNIISKENREIANKRFKKLGFKITFGEHTREIDRFLSSSIEARVSDIEKAFKDPNVKMIISAIGGYNSNQLLSYLNWNLIKKNPKIFCGYSDITVLLNAIFAKTKLITYHGPHYSSFAERLNFSYTLKYFKKCLMEKGKYKILPSPKWSDDKWYQNQKNRHFIKNEGWYKINKGRARGTILGGNLCSFNLLLGTKYFPQIKEEIILFLEDDENTTAQIFDRNLQALIHQKEFKKVKGLVIGRFQKKSEISKELLKEIILSKKELCKIPVLANVDFGHTQPMFTFPIGGKASIDLTSEKPKLEIVLH